ncbi:glycine zipper 2TM domain-containing protein [Massilia consociata]|uniref:Glycine zipper 2TM domain-containing protein n=1 Tax=Massilia consociata TaxID=760117 RepID=A0ABV6FHE5_9BURK
MNFRNLLHAVFAAALVSIGTLGPAVLDGANAHAQQYQNSRAHGPVINGFNVEEVRRLTPGVELHFDLYGSPGGMASLRIDGATRNLNLTEVEPGQYAGTYTIGTHDRIRPESGVTATLRLGNQVATSVLGESLLQPDAPRSRRGELAEARTTEARQARYCTNCAVVEAVNVVEVAENGNYLGTIGGAAVGGMLGSQVGSGSGRTAASVAGAVAGGMAGRNIQRNMNRSQRYEVLVRYSTSGATQTLQYENDPGFRMGDRVRVSNGVLTRDQ